MQNLIESKQFKVVFMIGVFLLGFALMVYEHEQAHKQTCIYFGGNVTEESYTFLSAYTKCDVNNSMIALANSNIEGFGYQLIAFYIAIGLLMIIYFISKGGWNEM